LTIESDRLPEGREIQFYGTTALGGSKESTLSEDVRIASQPGGLLLDFRGRGSADLTLFDLSGRKIRQEKGFRSVRISGLDTGCYFLRITASGEILSRKLFIHDGT
jgi:hypothetical protein